MIQLRIPDELHPIADLENLLTAECMIKSQLHFAELILHELSSASSRRLLEELIAGIRAKQSEEPLRIERVLAECRLRQKEQIEASPPLRPAFRAESA